MTTHTHLVNHFDEHLKFKNKIEIKILSLAILIKISYDFKDILNIICFKMSFTNFAFYLC